MPKVAHRHIAHIGKLGHKTWMPNWRGNCKQSTENLAKYPSDCFSLDIEEHWGETEEEQKLEV